MTERNAAMSSITTLCALIGYATVVGLLFLGRLDYRKVREKGEDWDAR